MRASGLFTDVKHTPVALRAPRSLMAALMLMVMPLAAAAQGSDSLALNRFRPSKTTEDGFALSRPGDLGHLRWGAQVYVDYANDPLIYQTPTQSIRVVSDQLTGTATVALGLWNRLVLYGAVPVNLWSDGRDTAGLPPTRGAYIGDPSVGARLRLVGENKDMFGLSVQGTVGLPVARWADDTRAYIGDKGVTVAPELLLELRPGRVRITGNVGVLVRDNYTFSSSNLHLNDALTYGLGVTVWAVKERLALLAEAYGSTSLNDFASANSSPLELIGGVKAYSRRGWMFGAAAGPGFLQGIGSPDFRVLGTLGYGKPEKKKEAKKTPAPIAAKDSDGDGIVDTQDACPNDAEDKDGYQDGDGCPDLDNDGDGVADAADRCPSELEDKDSYEDEDGCPDLDNDGDGVADANDRCPMAPEDKDGFEDEDGCPDVDNDQDTVLDADDACPTAPGTPELKGCPKSVRMGEGEIVLLERVEFANGKARILPASFAMLGELKATLAANPQIVRIRVEGHTDNRGKDARNLKLSKERANSVRAWLVEHGIEMQRAEAYGCGETRPIADNKSADGRQQNRRVEFHVIDPAPVKGLRSTEGCEAAE